MPIILPQITIPYSSPSYPRYGSERVNFWNVILQLDMVKDSWFQKWYWDTWSENVIESVGEVLIEQIDAYVFEHYAEELKKPETIARIIGSGENG